MDEFLENLKEALKENPNLVLDIPVKIEYLAHEELQKLFTEDESADDETEISE